MSNEFEYVGGHIWSLLEQDENGYDKTVLSVEIEAGKIFVFSQGRPLSNDEFEKFCKLIKPILI